MRRKEALQEELRIDVKRDPLSFGMVPGSDCGEGALHPHLSLLLPLPWVCRRRVRLRDGSANSTSHATRLEVLRTLVAEGYQTLVGITE
jgi:hypothetical protein